MRVFCNKKIIESEWCDLSFWMKESLSLVYRLQSKFFTVQYNTIETNRINCVVIDVPRQTPVSFQKHFHVIWFDVFQIKDSRFPKILSACISPSFSRSAGNTGNSLTHGRKQEKRRKTALHEERRTYTCSRIIVALTYIA